MHLIGVITSDDILEAVSDEFSDDYAKLGGLSGEEDLKEPIFKSVRKRIPWLFILLGLGLVTSLLIYDHAIISDNSQPCRRAGIIR